MIGHLGVRYRRGRKSKWNFGNAKLSAAAEDLRNANREIGVPGIAPVSANIAKLEQAGRRAKQRRNLNEIDGSSDCCRSDSLRRNRRHDVDKLFDYREGERGSAKSGGSVGRSSKSE
jgi:hypothetical protein